MICLHNQTDYLGVQEFELEKLWLMISSIVNLVDNTTNPVGTGHITKKNVGPGMHLYAAYGAMNQKRSTQCTAQSITVGQVGNKS